ncbi:hypothetical protein [Mucilaginibacter endophyticus]|uniref:hypothetical protein n=1 Tax=Mucilaginibacter endophyticus TaxID=2675003 RepID=UPI000E0D88C6|nr:hypothetical protein [Mucilaginibacter endophyticus]
MINIKVLNKYILLLALLITACKGKNQSIALQVRHAPELRMKHNATFGRPKLIEAFADSVNVGRKKNNKLELERYAIGDSNYVVIRFFSKDKNKWMIRNEFHFPKKDKLTDCGTDISDFNGDGFNDMTFISAIGARAVNEVRRLFIYDRKNDGLINIKNSEDFPNMLYNKGLNCIDAFLISGCNATVFLKLEADSLRKLASVDQCDSLTVRTYDKKGVSKLILTKQTNHDDFSRFKNYSPLMEYTTDELTEQIGQ